MGLSGGPAAAATHKSEVFLSDSFRKECDARGTHGFIHFPYRIIFLNG